MIFEKQAPPLKARARPQAEKGEFMLDQLPPDIFRHFPPPLARWSDSRSRTMQDELPWPRSTCRAGPIDWWRMWAGYGRLAHRDLTILSKITKYGDDYQTWITVVWRGTEIKSA